MTEVVRVEGFRSSFVPGLFRIKRESWVTTLPCKGLISQEKAEELAHLYFSRDQAKTISRRLDSFKEYVKGKQFFPLILEKTLIGCAVLKEMDQAGSIELYSFDIRKKYRRNGHGTQLMKHVLSYIQKKGYQSVHVWFFSHNVAAQKFYEMLGFTHPEEDTWRMSDSVLIDLIHMRKDL